MLCNRVSKITENRRWIIDIWAIEKCPSVFVWAYSIFLVQVSLTFIVFMRHYACIHPNSVKIASAKAIVQNFPRVCENIRNLCDLSYVFLAQVRFLIFASYIIIYIYSVVAYLFAIVSIRVFQLSKFIL